jgi:DNA-binding Lrp family transcriptional regulator
MPKKNRNSPRIRSLDRTDGAILAALQKNARLPNKQLAERVGVAPSTCLERVRRLAEDGVLRGFHAAVEPKALGIGLQALMAIRLAAHSRDEVASFRAHLGRLPEVVGLYHVAGADDFLVHLAVRDADHLRDLALEAFAGRPEVGHIETALIYEHRVKPVLPDYASDGEE